MEGMEILTSLQFVGCLLPSRKANVLECLARMGLGKHPSLVWYGGKKYSTFHFSTKLTNIFIPCGYIFNFSSADDWARSTYVWHCLCPWNGYTY